ncbi:MAG: FG-GAP repeat domain-containing protein [Phycisphaeraceae bacterium]
MAILFALLGLLVTVSRAHAELDQPWPRHTIDNRSRGADGVRLADANGDGLQDIVTGWEEAGVVRLYLNPGPDKSKDKWPAVTVGKAGNVEDAVMVDLDQDGAIDVVSSCEGKTKTMYVHWGPKDKSKLLDEGAWATEAIPATAGLQQWMYCLPMQVDARRGVDLVVGSKNKGASVGWLESPANPRDLKTWTYHKICNAGWIMSLEPAFDPDVAPATILVTDRKGEHRGTYLMRFTRSGAQPEWHQTTIELGQAEYMFASYNRTGRRLAVATRDGAIRVFDRLNAFSAAESGKRFDVTGVPNPFNITHGKAVAWGKIDEDEHADLVVSFNTQGQHGKPGVSWIKVDPDKDPKDWRAFNIAGLEGKKFDRIELIDLDNDGDLDVLTCEEADNLGVVWYENPRGPRADNP